MFKANFQRTGVYNTTGVRHLRGIKWRFPKVSLAGSPSSPEVANGVVYFDGGGPTPNPLEIVVTLRHPDDDPDKLAALVESLRYSFGHYREWTSLPAPLFFERVVRDYISEFAVEDEEIEADPETPQ